MAIKAKAAVKAIKDQDGAITGITGLKQRYRKHGKKVGAGWSVICEEAAANGTGNLDIGAAEVAFGPEHSDQHIYMLSNGRGWAGQTYDWREADGETNNLVVVIF